MINVKEILIGSGDPKVMAACIGLTGAALVANELYYNVYLRNKMEREMEKNILKQVRIREAMKIVERRANA